MSSTVPTKYAIVQHSGFGYNSDLQFEQGLEIRTVSTVAEQRAVEKAGGLLFDDWKEADDFTDKAMYPSDGPGLIPNARGTFADLKIDGLRVYIPVREVTG